MVDDLIAVSKANELCNRYGMDSISAGGIVAFAMEAYERGILTRKDTDGIELVWGSGEAMVKMIEKMGRREEHGRLAEPNYRMGY
jgi:aldehyde:ferredoxin oxidoreductase